MALSVYETTARGCVPQQYCSLLFRLTAVLVHRSRGMNEGSIDQYGTDESHSDDWFQYDLPTMYGFPANVREPR
jgi:hypothetical protein